MDAPRLRWPLRSLLAQLTTRYSTRRPLERGEADGRAAGGRGGNSGRSADDVGIGNDRGRSLAFGPVGSLIWAARDQLRPFCVDILREDGSEAEIKANVWRVLTFVGHSEVEKLVDPLAPGPVSQDYALLGPSCVVSPAISAPTMALNSSPRRCGNGSQP